MTLIAGLNTTWLGTYPSRDQYTTAAGGPSLISQRYGWNVAVNYMPLPTVMVAMSLQHASPVLDNGFRRVVVAHRDQTEFVLTVGGAY
jgi:hypothetical protein